MCLFLRACVYLEIFVSTKILNIRGENLKKKTPLRTTQCEKNSSQKTLGIHSSQSDPHNFIRTPFLFSQKNYVRK